MVWFLKICHYDIFELAVLKYAWLIGAYLKWKCGYFALIADWDILHTPLFKENKKSPQFWLFWVVLISIDEFLGCSLLLEHMVV